MQNNSGPQSPNGHEADWDAIARFIAGESDPVESRAVQAWLDAHPGDAGLVAAVQRRAGMAESHAQLNVNVDGALARVRARMDAESIVDAAPRLSVSDGGVKRDVAAKRTPGAARIAAEATPRRGMRAWQVALLASAAALAVFVSRGRNGAEPTSAEQVFATKIGARDSVKLSDGTRVILAPGSKLTVAAGYGASTRDVTLEGAAFFEVEHDEAHPFTVHAKGAVIRDIGTAFTVKTDEVGNVAVAVTHGVVAVGGGTTAAKSSVELRAGDRGVVQGEQVAVSRGTVTDDDVSWTHGKLAYRDATLLELQADLRRWYGVELRFGDPTLAKRTMNIPFQADSAADVIKVISLALGVDAVTHGDTVTLQMPGRSTTP